MTMGKLVSVCETTNKYVDQQGQIENIWKVLAAGRDTGLTFIERFHVLEEDSCILFHI